jgi:hypothetical protein
MFLVHPTPSEDLMSIAAHTICSVFTQAASPLFAIRMI